jgi:parvulin-like peptidyl-prolyl isomerase
MLRFVCRLLILLALGALCGFACAPSNAQEFMDIASPDATKPSAIDAVPLGGALPEATQLNGGAPAPLTRGDSANLEGCQKIAQIDDQIILACEVLWRVNQLIEQQKQKVNEEVTPEQEEAVRRQLMKKQVAALVDRKLLFNEFKRNVPGENLPRIEQNLRQPFEEKELPSLMKQLHVDNKRDLEKELARLGSSLADEQRSFNERIIAAEWIHSKVKVSEEVSPDEMMAYYRAHLKEYDYPLQARWEELAVRKDRFKEPREAYAALAIMGNEVWQQHAQRPTKGAAFAEIAKAKSDGFTAKRGGDHDWTTKGALSCKAIDDALFSLQVGQMSLILDGGPMFHIVRVLERKEAGRKAYTEVQADIRERLKEERFQTEVEKYLTQLRSESRIWTVFTGNTSAEVLLGRKPEETQSR